ncbi:MAG: hypothetical protein CR991_01865 [Proteobacteria bacterium]|nr:MAG: hypothetical protein CR991_01865 [Pseudomonadota bacterium]
MWQRLLKKSLIFGIPFGLLLGLYLGRRFDVHTGWQGGIAGGLLFGLLIGSFSEVRHTQLQIHDQLFEGENVLLHSPANHFGKHERSGQLILTPTRLIFRFYTAQLHPETLEMELATIQQVRPIMLLGFIPYGLSVKTDKKILHYFAVHKRNTWVKQIEKQRKALQDAG